MGALRAGSAALYALVANARIELLEKPFECHFLISTWSALHLMRLECMLSAPGVAVPPLPTPCTGVLLMSRLATNSVSRGNSSTLRWIGATAILFVILVTASPGPASTQASPTVDPPPSSLSGPAVYKTFHRSADRSLVAAANWDSTSKLVTIRTLQHVPGGKDRKVFLKQSVRYWPTCVAKVSDLVLCVTGRSPRTGNTIVEIWRLKAPTVSGDGTTVIGAAIESIQDVYDELDAARGDVRAILPLWKAGNPVESILLWFEQSRTVWKLQLDSGALVAVATPAAASPAGSAGFHAPFLMEATRAWAGIEAGGDFVYVFDRRHNDVALAVDQPSLLVLRDAQRDGTIESSTLETAAALIAAGWNHASHWTAW